MKRIIHLVFWLVFILAESILYFSRDYGGIGTFSEMLAYIGIITVPRILIAYFFVGWFLPNLDRQGFKWIKGILLGSIFLFLGLVFYRWVINIIAWPLIIKQCPNFNPFDIRLSSYSFFRLITPIALLYMIDSIMNRHQEQQRLAELEKINIKTELELLKSQINPHFLFNTLNNIYVLANKNARHTAAAVAKLSRLLRFMLYESQEDKVPLSIELDIIRSYLELEQLRYSNRLRLHFEDKVENQNQLIAPLLLLPFIENAFKHGASESTKDIDIHIEVVEQAEKLSFLCKNSVEERHSTQHGMGLKNVYRRLELLYPDTHQLDIKANEYSYVVNLNIQL